MRLGPGLGGQFVALQLDVEPVAEHPRHLGQRRIAVLGPAGGIEGIDGSVRPAREQDQAGGVLSHLRPGHMRLVRRVDVEIGRRREVGQVLVAGRVLGQQHDRRWLGPTLGGPLAYPADRQGAADDGLHAGVLGCDGKFEGAEEVGPIRNGHGGHVVGGGERADLVGLDGAFEQRIGRAHPQVHETLGFTRHVGASH